MRSLKFGWLKDKFVFMRGDARSKSRFMFMLYAVPTFFAITGAVINYVTHTFIIYLKYQAMVDQYYYSRVVVPMLKETK